MGQQAFFFDQSRCYSCHDCAVACKDWNGLEAGPEKWMTVYEWETGAYPELRVHSLAFPCAHCASPACIKVCKEGAIFKEQKYGAVLVDAEKCIGCRQCLIACPYGAPKFASDAPDTKMSKCTMCIDRLENDELPICVSSCPLRAFDFGSVEDMEKKYGTQRQLDEMPSPETTKPHFITKEAAPKKQLIPYDSNKALELMQQRGDIGTVFEQVEDVIEFEENRIKRSKLVMKHKNASALLAETKNNAG